MRSNMSGVGFYNSEPRNFNRGFGRGSPKPYYQSSQPPPSPQPSRRGDLFVEAGKLAVEYLVSHGLLASNVVPGKVQNGSLRNNNGESEDHRGSQERELSNSLDGRSVAIARPRAASPDGVSSSRRSPNDQDMSISRSYSRERRKLGASRSYSSDWSRENGRVVSVPEKTSSSQPMEVDHDKYPKDSPKEEISDLHIAPSTEAAIKDDRHSDGQHETEICRPLVDLDSKIASPLHDNDDGELPKPTDKVKEETKEDTSNHDKAEDIYRGESPIQRSENNNDVATKENTNVTKIHSFFTDTNLNEESNIGDTKYDSCADAVKDEKINGSSGIPSTNEIPSSSCPPNALSDLSFRSTMSLDSAHAVNQQKSVASLSFMDTGFSLEQESSGFSELPMCSSKVKDRGEKRALDEDRTTEGAKKAKQWLSVAQSDEYLQVSDLSDKKLTSVEKSSASIFNESTDQESFPNVSLPLESSVEPAIDRGEEKQLFSGSYKICDLNLMEASDMHENHGVAPVIYPSMSSPKKAQIDIDLSMSSNCSFNSDYNDSGSVRKDVEIIDLEGSSMEECKSSKLSTKAAEAGVTSVENFENNPQPPNDNPDGQDGYGFMISELLGNDVPNCSTVPPDVNSLHNDMGLHHEEGMFSEDDPIYMSLGEIPLTGLLREWEQPTQDRNPFEL